MFFCNLRPNYKVLVMNDKTKSKNKPVNIKNSSLGQRVRDLRNAKGWTQTDLANMAGVTYQNIQFCENDKIKMPRYIKELAESLGTSIEYLVKGEEQPNVVHIQQHISIVSVDNPVKPDPNYDYHLVKVKKGEPLFVPKGAEIVGQVN